MDTAVLEELKRYEPELIAIRRDIHRHPEIGFEEVRTAELVADRLRGWGIEVAEGIAKTGVVGTLKGKRPGQRAIGLRADLDALHIREIDGTRLRARQFPARCTPAATTATPRCCSARRAISPSIPISAARCISSSSRPKKASAAAA